MVEKVHQSGKAKATMLYLVKEYAERFKTIGKETMRRMVLHFKDEKDE